MSVDYVISSPAEIANWKYELVRDELGNQRAIRDLTPGEAYGNVFDLMDTDKDPETGGQAATQAVYDFLLWNNNSQALKLADDNVTLLPYC